MKMDFYTCLLLVHTAVAQEYNWNGNRLNFTPDRYANKEMWKSRSYHADPAEIKFSILRFDLIPREDKI